VGMRMGGSVLSCNLVGAADTAETKAEIAKINEVEENSMLRTLQTSTEEQIEGESADKKGRR